MKKILYILSAVAILAGCSKHDTIDDTLPQGKHPMSFTASVGELEVAQQSALHSKAATRATDQLPMRISIDNGANYTDYTLSVNGSLAPTNVGEELYWKKNTERISAYTPVTIGSGGIDIANQSSGWGVLGYVGVVPATEYTFRKTPIALTLQPAMAKVNVNLVAGDGVSETELSSATIVLSGYTQANMNAITFVLEGSGANSAITPKGDNKAFEALLMPQQMQGKRFVRVTLGGLNYYYTPANTTDADLTAGKQYTYTITVNKDGITVTASGAQEWTGTTTDVIGKDWKQGFAPSDLKIGDYYYSDGTWSDGGYRKYTDGSKAMLPIIPILTDARGNARTVIGIVIHIRDGSSPRDDCNYKKFNGVPTGYVLSIDELTGKWATYEPNKDDKTSKDVVCGYTNTIRFKDYNDLVAIPWCMNHNAVPATSSVAVSDWYMPSIQELKMIKKELLSGFNANLKAAGGAEIKNSFYFSSGLMGLWGNYLYVYNPVTTIDEAPWKDGCREVYPFRAMFAFRLIQTP